MSIARSSGVLLLALTTIIATHGYSCSVAIAYSGHVRSFVHPSVYRSALRFLIEPMREAGCEVDIYMYLSVEDEVPPNRDDLSGWNNFTAHTPEMASVSAALAEFGPAEVEYHKEQAGYIPNACPPLPGLPRMEGAFWQLYKVLAAFRMVERGEERRRRAGGRPHYDWVIRSRPDIGWIRPILPPSQFPEDRVYFGTSFWPMSDQFALVPRALAADFFSALHTMYSCEAGMAQQSSSAAKAAAAAAANGGDAMAVAAAAAAAADGGKKTAPWYVPGAGAPESLLFRHLVEREIPFQYYDFYYAIVRFHEGGKCDTLLPHKHACVLLDTGGRLERPAGNDACSAATSAWNHEVCRQAFPAPLPPPLPGQLNSFVNDHLEGSTQRQQQQQPKATPALLEARALLEGLLAAVKLHGGENRSGGAAEKRPKEIGSDAGTVTTVMVASGHADGVGVIGQVATAYRLESATLDRLALAFRCELWQLLHWGTPIVAAECLGDSEKYGRNGGQSSRLHDVWLGLWEHSRHVGMCAKQCTMEDLDMPPGWLPQEQ